MRGWNVGEMEESGLSRESGEARSRRSRRSRRNRRSKRSRNRKDEGSACNKGPKKDQRTVEEVGEKECRQETKVRALGVSAVQACITMIVFSLISICSQR